MEARAGQELLRNVLIPAFQGTKRCHPTGTGPHPGCPRAGLCPPGDLCRIKYGRASNGNFTAILFQVRLPARPCADAGIWAGRECVEAAAAARPRVSRWRARGCGTCWRSHPARPRPALTQPAGIRPALTRLLAGGHRVLAAQQGNAGFSEILGLVWSGRWRVESQQSWRVHCCGGAWRQGCGAGGWLGSSGSLLCPCWLAAAWV